MFAEDVPDCDVGGGDGELRDAGEPLVLQPAIELGADLFGEGRVLVEDQRFDFFFENRAEYLGATFDRAKV